MAGPTSRALELLGLLQLGRTWGSAELCARLGVDPRTLRRDVDRLRALGYGVEARRGVGGGYRLGPGAQVPPLVLTELEATAVAVGLRTAQAGTVADLAEAAAGALAKLERSLASATRHRVAEVGAAVVPLLDAADPVTARTLALVARAVREHRELRIDYVRHDGESVRRRVEPHRVVMVGQRWYLVARDADRDAWRTLRLDRTTPREPLGARFVPVEIPPEQLASFTSRSISAAPYPLRARVRVRAGADEVRGRLGPAVAEVRDRGDGTCEVRTGGHRWEEVALYLGLLGAELEDVEPAALRRALADLGERFVRAGAAAAASADDGAPRIVAAPSDPEPSERRS